MNYILRLLLIIAVASSCNTQKRTVGKADHRSFEESSLSYLSGNTYKPMDISYKPVPRVGQEEFLRSMYIDIRYPADARERGIQGSVVYDVTIDPLGHVVSVDLVSGLGYGLDEEGRKAINRGLKTDFEPVVYQGEAVQVKYRIPVNFRLER